VREERDGFDLAGRDQPQTRSLSPSLFLCRHGETTLNAGGRLRGHSDPDLDGTGRQQARALARTLQPTRPTAILASPLRRAAQTADAIAVACGLTAEVSDELIDRDYGPQNGRLLEDVNAAWGSVDNAPGVEPWESVLDRARVALAEAGTRAMDGPVVLVSHDAINSALLAFLEPTRWSEPGAVPQPTGCLNILQREGDTWAVVVAGRPPPLATRDVVGTSVSERIRDQKVERLDVARGGHPMGPGAKVTACRSTPTGSKVPRRCRRGRQRPRPIDALRRNVGPRHRESSPSWRLRP
jgi:broad specificity phosphatase PhoE